MEWTPKRKTVKSKPPPHTCTHLVKGARACLSAATGKVHLLNESPRIMTAVIFQRVWLKDVLYLCRGHFAGTNAVSMTVVSAGHGLAKKNYRQHEATCLRLACLKGEITRGLGNYTSYTLTKKIKSNKNTFTNQSNKRGLKKAGRRKEGQNCIWISLDTACCFIIGEIMWRLVTLVLLAQQADP